MYIPTINAGDLDGDGDLDLTFSGWDRANAWAPYSKLLRNDGTGNFTIETPPAINAPVMGIADLDNNGLPDCFMIGNTNNNKFYFHQQHGFDTAVNRVHSLRDAAGKFYIFPNASIATGQRMVCGLGNAYYNLGWKLRGLPPGTYTWSVQTIDAGYVGSGFAGAETLIVEFPFVNR